MSIQSILHQTTNKQQLLAGGSIYPDASRCVQCGICNFNCPLGLDIRLHALQGLPMTESFCLTCGECVRRCPRGVLRFEKAPIMTISVSD